MPIKNTAIRIAVIGVGYLGRHHARILSELPDVNLVSVVDVNKERAKIVAAETNSRAETDSERLLGDIDAVILAVPTKAHRSVSLPFLRQGIPVLVEKPIATSVKEADEMISEAANNRTILAVGHTERYNPAVVVALPLIDEPKFIEVHRLSTFQPRSLDIDVVFDLMIHDLDVLLSTVKSQPVSIEAVGVSVLSERIDIANARIRFNNGCIANLTASRISREQIRKLRFFQKSAYISVDCAAQQVEAWSVTQRPQVKTEIKGGQLKVPKGEPLKQELLDFISAVRTGRCPGVDGKDGRRSLALAQKVAEAIKDVR